jgi:hypothetical protein
MIALASATGQARTLPASRTSAGGMVPCSMQFLMLPVLRSSDRPSSVIFTTAPRSAATAGLAFSSSRSSSKSQSPSISWSGSSWWRLLSLRRSPAYWAPCST